MHLVSLSNCKIEQKSLICRMCWLFGERNDVEIAVRGLDDPREDDPPELWLPTLESSAKKMDPPRRQMCEPWEDVEGRRGRWSRGGIEGTTQVRTLGRVGTASQFISLWHTLRMPSVSVKTL